MDRNEFISINKQFIYNTAYSVCKRKLEWENDDELSIAIIAFNKACDIYDKNKGSFLSFARVIIRNALIDYFRQRPNEVLMFFSGEDESEEQIFDKGSLSDFEAESENKNRAEELEELMEELKGYKISLEDLVNHSPSHKDTRDMLLNIAFKCSGEKTIIDSIHRKKTLPIKQIALLTNTKPKLLERWRKYMMSLILILSGSDYIYTKSYLNIKAGEKSNGR
ncbi:MAG: sigma-70 family RNA polymerase sigma factor [Clostridiaceae bacterium]